MIFYWSQIVPLPEQTNKTKQKLPSLKSYRFLLFCSFLCFRFFSTLLSEDTDFFFLLSSDLDLDFRLDFFSLPRDVDLLRLLFAISNIPISFTSPVYFRCASWWPWAQPFWTINNLWTKKIVHEKYKTNN